MVQPEGFEPSTPRLKVENSTSWVMVAYGVSKGDRTLNPLIKSQVPYQFGYGHGHVW